MFNPFKKKDNGFNLDEESLPSLNDSQNSSLPTLDESNLSDLNTDSSTDFNPNPIESNITPIQSESPFPTSDFTPTTNSQPLTSNASINEDITKAKLESLETKLTLTNAKLSNIEQKLELIYQLISEEVSDETKKKLNISNILKKFKE